MNKDTFKTLGWEQKDLPKHIYDATWYKHYTKKYFDTCFCYHDEYGFNTYTEWWWLSHGKDQLYTLVSHSESSYDSATLCHGDFWVEEEKDLLDVIRLKRINTFLTNFEGK